MKKLYYSWFIIGFLIIPLIYMFHKLDKIQRDLEHVVTVLEERSE